AEHATLGRYRFAAAPGPDGAPPELLFTENETNTERLFGAGNPTAHVKDAFHEYLVHGRAAAVNPVGEGTKAAAHYRLEIPAGGKAVLSLRLSAEAARASPPLGDGFAWAFEQRQREADAFYASRLPEAMTAEERNVARQGYAGLLWSKQFFHYAVGDWLEGDPAQPAPPAERRRGRNHAWPHLHNRDVISMPDKWEYPWYAAWDLAFHMIPFPHIDPQFAKEQLLLF